MAKHDLHYLLNLPYSTMAKVYGREEQWKEARHYYEKKVDVGGGSNDTSRRALTYQSISCMRLGQHEVIVARDLSTEAFQLRSETLGHHHDTTTKLHMLALCHCRPNDLISSQHATSAVH